MGSVLTAGLSLLAALAAPVAAQGLVPADSAEVAGHVVAEAEYDRLVRVVADMDSTFRSDPSAFRGLEQKADGPVTLASVAARYEANGALRAALARGGMTGRSFLVGVIALKVALRAAEREDASGLDVLPLSQLANVRLVRCRSGETSRLFEVLKTVITEE